MAMSITSESDISHRDCLLFTFMHIIETELIDVAREWNTHGIRPNHCSASVPGIPDELFFMPEFGGMGGDVLYEQIVISII